MSNSIWQQALANGDLSELGTEDEDTDLDLSHVHVVLSIPAFSVLTGLAIVGIAATINLGIRLIRR